MCWSKGGQLRRSGHSTPCGRTLMLPLWYFCFIISLRPISEQKLQQSWLHRNRFTQKDTYFTRACCLSCIKNSWKRVLPRKEVRERQINIFQIYLVAQLLNN